MKTDICSLDELAAEEVMGWKFVTIDGEPFWRTPNGKRSYSSWSPSTKASDLGEVLDTLRTYAVSKDREGCYFTVYDKGEAYEGFHENKKIAAILAILKSRGVSVKME